MKKYRKMTSVLVLGTEVPEAHFGGKTVSGITKIFLALQPMLNFLSLFIGTVDQGV